MRSWTLLLLLLAALLTTSLRLGNAEGDPLPSSLLDLLQDSPISSVEDLKLLLQHESNAKEDEEDEHDVPPNPAHGRYTRSLMEAQLAEPAHCKVRTEVMEVTRSMHDRHNANFMLWPSCVEVQRCSGCCSSRLLKCVPVMTSSRYLKVLKIMYIDRKAKYDPVVISVEDHVSCVCQASSQKPPPSSYVPAPPAWPVRPTLPRTHSSKADLHHQDNLKHNQQHHLPQEHEARQWQQGSYTQLLRWTQPRVHQMPTHAQTGTHQTVTGMGGSVGSWPSEARAEHVVMGGVQQAGHGSGFDRSREETGGEEAHRPDHEQRQQHLLQHQQRLQHQLHQQPQHPQQDNYKGEEEQELRTSQHWLKAPQSDSASPPVSLTQPPKFGGNSTPFPSITQKDSVTSQQFTEVTKDTQTETGKVGQKGGNEREESGSAISGDSAGAEPANQGRKRDSKVSTEDGSLTEEERRQKLLEMVQSEPEKTSLLHQQRHHHNHHHQQRPKPTTYKTAISTTAPRSAAARQTPLRPPRRKRKHRKRMSKDAMRAKIMKVRQRTELGRRKKMREP